MLVALCTWIVSCIIDQMRFFSDAWQALLFWAALLFPVLIFEYRFFSWVLVSCDCASTFSFRATVLPVSCCTCSPRCRVRDIQCRFRSNRQWNSASLLFFALRSELLGNELSSWIPTASAVRCYTAIQAFGRLLWFPLILSASLVRLLMSLCYGEFRNSPWHLLDLRDLFSLIDCTNASYLSVDEHSMLSCWVYLTLLYGAPANRTPSPTLLVLLLLLLNFLLLSIVRLLGVDESIGLIQYNVGKASNTKCYVELMSSSSCFDSS